MRLTILDPWSCVELKPMHYLGKETKRFSVCVVKTIRCCPNVRISLFFLAANDFYISSYLTSVSQGTLWMKAFFFSLPAWWHSVPPQMKGRSQDEYRWSACSCAHSFRVYLCAWLASRVGCVFLVDLHLRSCKAHYGADTRLHMTQLQLVHCVQCASAAMFCAQWSVHDRAKKKKSSTLHMSWPRSYKTSL